MAKKEHGSMQKFVNNKNAEGNQGWDDLKVPTKTGVSPNSHQLRTRGQAAKQATTVRADSRAHNAQQPGRRDSDGQRPFYDTDASSIGDGSTTTSAQRGNVMTSAVPKQQLAGNGEYNEQQRASSTPSSGSGSGDESEDLPAIPGAPKLSKKQQVAMKNIDTGFKKQPDGRNLPHVKGDTYPSTTSGRPSEPDLDHHNYDRPLPEVHRAQAALQAALPNRESTHRQPLGAVSTKQHDQAHKPANAKHAAQHPGTPSQLVRADNGVSVPVEQQVASGFSFAKAPKQPPSARPPHQNRQQSAPENATLNTHASDNTRQPMTALTTGVTSTHFAPQQRTVEHANGNVVYGRLPSGSKPQNDWYHPNHVQQHTVEPGPEYEQSSDDEAHVHDGITSDAQTHRQSKEHETQLDYETPDLFGMDYHELKGQSFDVDPNADDFKVHVEQQDDALETKLETVATLRPENQSHFFSSLSLDEWEQAGEWFLGRFSGVVSKLKYARQEKRKAAKLFEDEIESRFEAVGKKRKQIEESFVEMKESGGKVLQTPKKTKVK